MNARNERELTAEVRDTAQAIADLHAAHRADTTPAERRLEQAMLYVSTPGFLLVVTLVVSAWVGGNALLPSLGLEPFDPAPYSLLEVLLTLMGIYISLAILSGQRRAAALAELRSQVNLEHTILAEHKAAKMIELLEELRRDHPQIADRPDREARNLAVPTDPKDVAAAIVESHAERPGEADRDPREPSSRSDIPDVLGPIPGLHPRKWPTGASGP
jgi:uncharacterized membrane protein